MTEVMTLLYLQKQQFVPKSEIIKFSKTFRIHFNFYAYRKKKQPLLFNYSVTMLNCCQFHFKDFSLSGIALKFVCFRKIPSQKLSQNKRNSISKPHISILLIHGVDDLFLNK